LKDLESEKLNIQFGHYGKTEMQDGETGPVLRNENDTFYFNSTFQNGSFELVKMIEFKNHFKFVFARASAFNNLTLDSDGKLSGIAVSTAIPEKSWFKNADNTVIQNITHPYDNIETTEGIWSWNNDQHKYLKRQ
jgi:hypothetical protein